MSKTINLSSEQLEKVYTHQILDFENDLMIKIFQLNQRYAFRVLKKDSFTEIDPISGSSRQDWAYGLFNSPDECVDNAKELIFTLYQ